MEDVFCFNLLCGKLNIVIRHTLDYVIVKGCSTLIGLLTTRTPIGFFLFNFLNLKILTRKMRIMFARLVNFQIPLCQRLKLTARHITLEHLHLLVHFWMTRCNVCLQSQLVKKRIATGLAHMRTIAFMLLLQMVVKRGRVSMRMRRSRLRFEGTEMTHEVSIGIPLVTHRFLLLCL